MLPNSYGSLGLTPFTARPRVLHIRGMRSQVFKIKVIYGRLLLGILLIAGAAAVIGVFTFSGEPAGGGGVGVLDVISAIAIAGSGLFALVAGSALLYSGLDEVCATCERTIETYTTSFPIEHYSTLVEMVTAPGVIRLEALTAIPSPSPDAQTVAAIECDVCPHCRHAARLTVCKLRWNRERARYEPFDLTTPHLESGVSVDQLLNAPQGRGLRHGA